MIQPEFGQWAVDIERLLDESLLPDTEEYLSFDEETINLLERRCIKRFGEIMGVQYLYALIDTLPCRRPELFPEIFSPEGVTFSPDV